MSSSDVTWKEVLERTSVREWDPKLSSYIKVGRNDERYANYTHCSHVLIYAKTDSINRENFEKKAIILMQVRSDGFLGFPGGGVDPGETPVEAVNRELREENGWFEENGPITENHYLFSHANEKREMVFHFFAIEVSEDKVKEIEANTLHASDYGEEVLGSCRVPLYTMKDSYCGFPSFLHNNFIGNAKLQLIEALISLKFLTDECVIQALTSRPQIK